ncbi:PDZ domain-containing protein [Sulfurimonas crateris]|uniref:PDZ domain-containing protein n=1 Tax=Sulfurimonas crateris TaxID=2574727 RepID=A0A4U2Z9H6_9BACT|nr:PDZ domain-containing protein [Sulfurimonas crateris]TKI71136.1 PDZ domain-containing protein [Sulfurimonas crateris]
MLRLLLALNLLFLNLYACKGGFDSCRLKVVDANVIKGNSLHIPLKNNQKLIFSTTTPNAKIIKHDPYLSLYLVEDNNCFKYPFRVNINQSLGTFGVDKNSVIEGKILKRQIGLNSFALFSEPLSAPSVLLNSCCAIEGIVTERGIIEKEYIERFLKVKKVNYGDFGVRVKDVGSDVVVFSSNPFIEGNRFKKGDIIVELDGKKVKNSASFMRDVLFSEIGSVHSVKIRRGDELLTFSAKSQNRLGGGYLSDTFLEFLGISFDKNLFIIKIEKKAQQYGLKLGDQLLQVNKKNVRQEGDILEIIDNRNKSADLLFEREHFQFFVKVN